MLQTWSINLDVYYKNVLRNISYIFTKVFLVIEENQTGAGLNLKRSPKRIQTVSFEGFPTLRARLILCAYRRSQAPIQNGRISKALNCVLAFYTRQERQE